MARRWRLFVPELATQLEQERISITGDEAHHATKVLRLRVAEPVELFDGRGCSWSGTVAEVERDRLVVSLGGPLEPSHEARLQLTLFQARLRSEKLEWVVQKATELGVARIVIFNAERCDAPPLKANRWTRLQRIAVEACKQSGRELLPELEQVDGLPQAATEAAWILDPGVAPAVERPALAEAAAIAIGPESGFSEAELAAAQEGGWKAISLGNRVLRAETAGPIVAALLLKEAGEFGDFFAV